MQWKTALVLAGGGARGAYEAGVVSYLRDELEPKLGKALNLDVLTGTSVGAIHACFLAATADVPSTQGHRLVAQWHEMVLDRMLQFGYGDLFRLVRESLTTVKKQNDRAGGLVDPAGLRAVVGQRVPWRQIQRNVDAGHFEALSVSATDVGSGHTRIFVQRKGGGAPPWGKDISFQPEPTRIGPSHALASAAIPVLFPAVRIKRRLFVDGGLRLNVPLSPALRLGAQRVVVVSLHPVETAVTAEAAAADQRAFASAPFLMGKALNALMLDRTDQDLDRLRRFNTILEAGTVAYGPGFRDTLNAALMPMRNAPIRQVRTLRIRPSVDLAAIAADYVRTPAFQKRDGKLAHRTILRLVDREADRRADLASYLLFDGGYADQLISLGRQDARAREADWLAFFNDEPQTAAERAQASE